MSHPTNCACRGTGQINCYACNGTGQDITYVPKYKVDICHNCGGSGRKTCFNNVQESSGTGRHRGGNLGGFILLAVMGLLIWFLLKRVNGCNF